MIDQFCCARNVAPGRAAGAGGPFPLSRLVRPLFYQALRTFMEIAFEFNEIKNKQGLRYGG